MRVGWLGILRDRADERATDPDRAVTGLQRWLIRGVLLVSALALVASGPPPPNTQTEYLYSRLGIDAGGIDLSAEQPKATLFITVQADALAPDDIVSTNDASITFHGTATGPGHGFVSIAGHAPGDPSPPDGRVVVSMIEHRGPLEFAGNCTSPTAGEVCKARYVIELSLLDAHADNAVHIDATLDVSSRAVVPADESSSVGPIDPPWTVTVSR